MGMSTDISSKQATDAKFRTYMDDRKKDGEGIQLELVKQMVAQRDKYYTENKYTHTLYLANGYQEFQNTSKWSLDNVNKIIGAVSKVLLGDNKDSKDVKTTDGDALKKIGEGAAALVANQQLVVSRVFDAVTSILGTFDVVSESKRVAKQEHFPVLAGLHLFMSVSNETFKSQEFFTSEYLNQLNICYEVHFSEEEAAREGRIDSATQYFDEIVILNGKLKKMNRDLVDVKTPEEFTKLESFISMFEKRRDAAQDQLDNINKARKALKNMAMTNSGVALDLTGAPRDTGSNTRALLSQAGSWPDAALIAR